MPDVSSETIRSGLTPLESLGTRWALPSSYLGSCLLHSTLFGLLALLVLPGQRTASEPEHSISVTGAVDTRLSDGLGDSLELAGGFAPLGQEAAATESAGATEPQFLSHLPAEHLAVLKTDGSAAFSQMPSEFPPGTLGENVGSAKIGSARGAANGRGTGTGSGTGTSSGTGTGTGTGSARFFGIGQKYKSLVFVVDASGSMNRPYPGPALTRFNRVKFELQKTISAMTAEDRFFIIFFGDNATPMPARTLATADDASKQFYLSWMAQVEARSNQTWPQEALLLALKLEPEAIYFLTDGNFSPQVVPRVTKANSKQLPIHTIGFGDNIGEPLLQEIARQNGGTYTFIPSDGN